MVAANIAVSLDSNVYMDRDGKVVDNDAGKHKRTWVTGSSLLR